jgi:DNA-binding GntR family transcriptional regulator
MSASKSSSDKSFLLVKESLAAKLKEAIVSGTLKQGERIVERYWAHEFGVAQTSVREAINLLINEGFATKHSGRSARVTSYSTRDIANMYEVRASLEGLAARLLSQAKADLGPLRNALERMAAAIEGKNIRAVLESDLIFHVRLCELPGNEFLAQQARTLLLPLFAFVSIRIGMNSNLEAAWEADLDRHAAIIRVIEEGEPMLAELSVRHAIERFALGANDIWR